MKRFLLVGGALLAAAATVRQAHGVPAWLLYLLWDEELYRVVELDA